jgi:hypothetical protein
VLATNALEIIAIIAQLETITAIVALPVIVVGDAEIVMIVVMLVLCA